MEDVSYNAIYGLVLFAIVTTLTPGPNVVMLIASGANFGFARSTSHILGVIMGFFLLFIIVGLNGMKLFNSYPAALPILKTASVLYLSYLGYTILNSSMLLESQGEEHARPLTMVEAAVFQWLNPKAWFMSLSAISLYVPSSHIPDLVLAAVIYCMIGLPCTAVWALLGEHLRNALSKPSRMRNFNRLMALMLLLSLYPLFAMK